MNFIKSNLPAPRDARILLHVGEGLDRYSFSAFSSLFCAENLRDELGRELKWWASALTEVTTADTRHANLIFPEVSRTENAAVCQVFTEIAKTLQQPNAKLSIATQSKTLAQLIVNRLVQLGLQQNVQVFCHENHKVARGWLLDQDTALATDAFDLNLSVDEDFIRQLDFGVTRTAA
jgi:hypothetical protein